jgi:hypothetical protein
MVVSVAPQLHDARAGAGRYGGAGALRVRSRRRRCLRRRRTGVGTGAQREVGLRRSLRGCAASRSRGHPCEAPAAAQDAIADDEIATDKDKKGRPSDTAVAEGEAVEAKPDPAANEEAPAKPTDAGRGMSSLGDAPGGVQGGVTGASPGQAQTKAGGSAGPASGRWDIVSRGDRARLAGDCVAARDEYALALEDDEASVRARAFAGLGLCDAAAGDEASADANYERARGLDDTIGKYLDSQSERSAAKKSKPAKKSKAQVDAFDPF